MICTNNFVIFKDRYVCRMGNTSQKTVYRLVLILADKFNFVLQWYQNYPKRGVGIALKIFDDDGSHMISMVRYLEGR